MLLASLSLFPSFSCPLPGGHQLGCLLNAEKKMLEKFSWAYPSTQAGGRQAIGTAPWSLCTSCRARNGCWSDCSPGLVGELSLVLKQPFPTTSQSCFSAGLGPSPTSSPTRDTACQCTVRGQPCSQWPQRWPALLVMKVPEMPSFDRGLFSGSVQEDPAWLPALLSKHPLQGWGAQHPPRATRSPHGTLCPAPALRVCGATKVTAATMHHRRWQCVKKPDEAIFRSAAELRAPRGSSEPADKRNE